MTASASPCSVPTTSTREERRDYIEASVPRPGSAFQWGIFVEVPLLGSVFFDRRENWECEQPAWTSWRDFFAIRPNGPCDFSLWAGAHEVQFSMPGGRPYHTLMETRAVRALWWMVGIPLLVVALAAAMLWRPLAARFGWRLKRLALHLAWTLWPRAMDRQFALDTAKEGENARLGAEALAKLAARVA